MYIATLIFRAANQYSLTKKLQEFTNFECFNLGMQLEMEGCTPPLSLS